MKYRRMQVFKDLVNGVSLQDFMTWQNLRLLAGVRMDFFRRDFGIYNTDDRKLLDRTTDQILTNAALTYRLGAVYNITPSFNVYGSVSSFFKPQRITLSPEVVYMAADGHEMSAEELKSFKPLTGRQWEAGLHLESRRPTLTSRRRLPYHAEQYGPHQPRCSCRRPQDRWPYREVHQ